MDGIKQQKIIDNYIKHCKRQDKTEKTIENYISTINIFKEFVTNRNQNILSGDGNKELFEDFLDYLRDERKISYARIKTYFSAISHLYDFLQYNSYIKKNLVLNVRKMYVRQFKNGYTPQRRKVISIEEMSNFLNSILDLRSKAICLLLVKTGIRRNELINIDIDDIDWIERSIELKPIFHKRTNTTVFFDEETEMILKQWIKRRKNIVTKNESALFVSDFGKRLKRRGIYDSVVKWTTTLGYHDPDSNRLKDKFTVHNMRHVFTDFLRQAGMPRAYIQELRGDSRNETIDIYTHISKSELRKSYNSYIPKLDVY
jgi:integrase/recombinase XerD